MNSDDGESPYYRERFDRLVERLADAELERTGTEYALHSGRVDGLPTRHARDWEMAWGDFLAEVYPLPPPDIRAASGGIYQQPYPHVTLDIWTEHGQLYDRVTIVATGVLEDGLS